MLEKTVDRRWLMIARLARSLLLIGALCAGGAAQAGPLLPGSGPSIPPGYSETHVFDLPIARPTLQTSGQEAPGRSERESVRSRISWRRSMLSAHQWTGILAWGFWLATNLAGEQALRGLHRRNEDQLNFFLLQNPQQNYLLWQVARDHAEWESGNGDTHRSLATATWALYGMSAALAMLAPSRFEEAEREGIDSIFLHKSLALVHFAAMVALPFVAKRAEHEGPAGARAMQTIGWTGFGALTMSVVVLYF